MQNDELDTLSKMVADKLSTLTTANNVLLYMYGNEINTNPGYVLFLKSYHEMAEICNELIKIRSKDNDSSQTESEEE